MTETQINIPLLRKAVEWAEAEAAKPEVESAWFQPGIITPGEEIGRTCGTAYCIAGYIAHLVDPASVIADPIRVAFNALGIPMEFETDHGLFIGENSIEDIRRAAEELAGERL